MKIFIDIGHPAHVHYFKNFTWIMQNNSHQVFISARKKDCTIDLLKAYNLTYMDRGQGGKKLLGKIIYIPCADYLLYKLARNVRPDIFLSFGSSYAAHVSKLIQKPHIAFDDTEHAILEHLLYVPCTDLICTPSCFKKSFGEKQIRFNGYMELCSLHPNNFQPNPSILNELKIGNHEKYVILRFVSWNASHDMGQSGLTLDAKKTLIDRISKMARVFISSEEELPDSLKQYQIKIPVEEIHQVLSYATLFIGEGATMASECAMLGTPAIYVNTLTAGTLEEQEKYGLLFRFKNIDGVTEKAEELLRNKNIKQEYDQYRRKMLADKIDVTAFMVWLVENYPESAKIMKKNPQYQMRFQ